MAGRGESITRIKAESSTEAASAASVVRMLATEGLLSSGAPDRVTLGDITASVPVHGWWAQFRRLLMPPLSLFRFTGACYAASLDREAGL